MSQVRVGLGVIVVKEDKILIGKRKGSHGAGHYGFPGGHLEFGEEIIDCAKRESFEEANIIISDTYSIDHITNDIMAEDTKHYITIFCRSVYKQGTVIVNEPDKCEKWYWMTWEEIKNLGEQLFLPIQNLIKNYPEYNPIKYNEIHGS